MKTLVLKAAMKNSMKLRVCLALLGTSISLYAMDEVSVLSTAVASDNPNHYAARTLKDVTYDLPVYYSADSKQKACSLLSLGADYTLRDRKDHGTVLHHVCTHPPIHQSEGRLFEGPQEIAKLRQFLFDLGDTSEQNNINAVARNGLPGIYFTPRGNHQDIIEMFKFYLDNKVDVHAVDDNGRTALHRVALHIGDYSLDLSIPFTLLLLRAGVKRKKKDSSGKTFNDYLRELRFMPGSSGVNSHTLLAHLEGQTEKPRDVLFQPQECDTLFCEEEHPLPTEDADKLTLRKAKKLVPFIPERCENVSCKSLRTDPACAHGMELLQYKHGVAPWPSDKVIALIQKEIQRALIDWHGTRSWIAMCIAARQFDADDDIRSLMTHALIEDDCALMQHMLRHQYPYTECNALGPRSVDMAKLLDHYRLDQDGRKNRWCKPFRPDMYGNTPFHHLAVHGALVHKDVYGFYEKQGVYPLAINRESITPFELLAEHSYRFEGKEAQLVALMCILWGKTGFSMYLQNPVTGKSLLEIARATHATWQLPVTQSFLHRLISWHMAYVYNKKVKDIAWQVINY